jgi:outer membrane receptor protein involved in Fe transport
VVPTLDEVPVGDHRSAEDRRTFWGFYANDEWTPLHALTLTFGARYDRTSESLDATVAEVGAPAPDVASDSRTEGAWSGGVSALIRLVDKPKASILNALNVYLSAKSNFKPRTSSTPRARIFWSPSARDPARSDSRRDG